MPGTVKFIPKPVKVCLLWLRERLTYLSHSGRGHWCPVCERSCRQFRTVYFNPGESVQSCIHCSSLERHRFVWFYLNQRTDLFNKDPKLVLHFAPEECFWHRFHDRLGRGYITVDIASRRAMVKTDITNIPYPDESFDVIYCSHVLEHVIDDKRAIRELYRVLKKGGWAVVLVPIGADVTIEDPSVVDPLERQRLYGEREHVRLYGPDFVDRLRDAGFAVSVISVSDICDDQQATRMGLARWDDIYHCTKPRV